MNNLKFKVIVFLLASALLVLTSCSKENIQPNTNTSILSSFDGSYLQIGMETPTAGFQLLDEPISIIIIGNTINTEGNILFCDWLTSNTCMIGDDMYAFYLSPNGQELAIKYNANSLEEKTLKLIRQ